MLSRDIQCRDIAKNNDAKKQHSSNIARFAQCSHKHERSPHVHLPHFHVVWTWIRQAMQNNEISAALVNNFAHFWLRHSIDGMELCNSESWNVCISHQHFRVVVVGLCPDTKKNLFTTFPCPKRREMLSEERKERSEMDGIETAEKKQAPKVM